MRILIVTVLLTGCGTFQAGPTGISGEGNQITDRETGYHIAQRDAAVAAAQAAAMPILEMEALPGQTLTISGLSRIAVRAPTTGQTGSIEQYRNPWAEVVGQIGGSVLPLAVGQIGAYAIVDSLGKTTQAISGSLASLGGDGFAALNSAGQQNADVATAGIEQAGRDPVVVEQPPPVIVPPPDPIIVEQPPPIIVEQPDPIITGG